MLKLDGIIYLHHRAKKLGHSKIENSLLNIIKTFPNGLLESEKTIDINKWDIDSCHAYYDTLFAIYSLLDKNHLVNTPEFDEKNMRSLLIKANRLKNILPLIDDLDKAQLLTQSAFEKAVYLTSLHLKKPSVSTCVKDETGYNQFIRPKLTIDQDFTIFQENVKNKSFPAGTYGSIKKGFQTDKDEIPTHAIKRYFELDSSGEAQHEGKYHQLFGEKVYLFNDYGRATLIYPWKHGETLFDYYFTNTPEFNIPLKSKMQCTLSFLTQLNVMHSQFRVHGDLRDKNVIIDIKHATMQLIDFNTSHRQSHYRGHLGFFGDHYERDVYFKFSDDMLAAGFIIKKLFDVPTGEQGNKTIIDTPQRENQNLAFNRLIQQLKSLSAEERPTCEQAMHYCEKIMERWETLTQQDVDSICESTINNKIISADDIMHGRKRVRISS